MAKTLCPVCSSRFRMKGQPRLHRPHVCPSCRTELTVRSVEPISFVWDELRAGGADASRAGDLKGRSWDDDGPRPVTKKRPPKPLRPAPPPWRRDQDDERDMDED